MCLESDGNEEYGAKVGLHSLNISTMSIGSTSATGARACSIGTRVRTTGASFIDRYGCSLSKTAFKLPRSLSFGFSINPYMVRNG